ncbi:hypothetical protein I204_05459 [Kwoniella mangroviensis CBS 8886]|uniref:uncharacterized protein n=1 Tax=Kwoniella mangroviensis CBS 8507 TaxID=1296122 RepID=UPI00080CF697|nr:uncharacterized protein I203_07615 [Kwoniella mangroviensis CBS 8507]OCF63191.1 hypothetical protein I203_07615 [Kwoniella mangroviensis CBS 8507]OCF73616.1 hypothetical protein I204_05459 [Kwoniella mangroviensis CBS 8886]
MLELYLTPKQGNVGGRFFPHTGHLGVTPVVISGKVGTRLPEVCEPLGVKSITLGIRCTETAGNGVSQVLWEKKKVLLTAPDDEEYLEMGDWDSMFKTTIPVDAIDTARSTMCIPEYKVVWRMEVVIEHRPIPYVGTSIAKAFALNLHSHRSLAIRPMSPPSPYILGSESYTSNITVSAQPGAFGPGDAFPVCVQVNPLDPHTTVKKASVYLERQMEVTNTRSVSPQSQHRLSSIFRPSHNPHQRLPEPQEIVLSRKDKLAEASGSNIVVDKSGTSWCQMEISLPQRHGKWDLGETHSTKLVSLSYTLKATVTLKSDKSRSSRSFSCSPVPIVIASTSTEDRAAAVKSIDSHQKKRHRSSRRGLYMHEGNVDVSDPSLGEPTPVYTSVKGIATDVKPILLPSNHPAQSQNIQFIFPSPPPYASKPMAVASLLNPASSSTSPSASTSTLPTPPPTRRGLDSEANNILRALQSTGRRISTTTSEEDEVQPSRSKQKVRADREGNDRRAEFATLPLPSLDALSSGLPYVPEDDRPRSRPRTAPIHSTFSMSIPPPLSGHLSIPSGTFGIGPRPMTSMARMGSDQSLSRSFEDRPGNEEGSFAFAFSGTNSPSSSKKQQ